MPNRNQLFPILLSATLSFTGGFLSSRAEPGVPNDTSNSAPAVTAPTPTPDPAAPALVVPTPAATTTPTPPPAASAPTTATPTARPTTYTVVTGDSLWLIAKKFNCSVKSLQKANNLTKKNLKPGQVLKIPPVKGKTTTPAATPTVKPDASTAPKKKSHQKVYAHAQPVQDFDVPASTFASCPVPDPATVPDAPAPTAASSDTTVDTTETSAPVAKLVTPEELDAETANAIPVAKPVPAPVIAVAKPVAAPAPAVVSSESDSSSASTFPNSSSKQSGHNSFFSSSSSSNSPAPAESNDWADRFMTEARALSDRGLEYDEDWRPPGESHAWAMDCSNTSRYLYKVTANIELPRTASDQYYYLHLQNKAWDVPQASDGYADETYLRENLKPGDLLFWENTYRPERQPPITHVMIYLGTDEKGEWLMVGSQSSHGGLHNRRGGGPDIYVFDPHKSSGGYTTWLGLVRHKGRFCAFGRPLEADPSKLTVASN